MKSYLLFLFLLWLSGPVCDADLRIFDVVVENLSDTVNGASVRFTLAWDHAWQNERNHDAAWVFLKFKPASIHYSARHALLRPGGHQVLAESPATLPDPVLEVAGDRVGIFIYPSARHRGAAQYCLRI